MNENIFLSFNECIQDDSIQDDCIQDEQYNNLLHQLNNLSDDNSVININNINNNLYSQFYDYELNYTIKQLLIICDYYGISKDLKSNKSNKCTIINTLILFENNQCNTDIVNKRKTLWFYINEVKSDKFMKKYVLW
jgi:hypothetical protein